jgi:EAL domain-containing protein (putative c-di-GMP-specific phosphodiesterase class I)
MYRAKQRGRGRIQIFSEDMRPHAAEDRTMEIELREALERDELVVLYQPVVEMGSRDVVAAEALVRWDHPTRGQLSPGLFIPLAEETGLIDAVGEHVLREACRWAERWTATLGERFSIAVNCSPSQLRDADFPSVVADALETSQVDPGCLRLEITERALVGGPTATGVLNSLAGMGVHVAIDDFGTGYSSLAHLRRLPVDTLKVDRTFVEGIDRSRDDSAIVAAVVEMAHALSLGVVAEGVEREEQVSALRACGCDRAQGYLFGPPGPPEMVDRLLAAA